MWLVDVSSTCAQSRRCVVTCERTDPSLWADSHARCNTLLYGVALEFRDRPLCGTKDGPTVSLRQRGVEQKCAAEVSGGELPRLTQVQRCIRRSDLLRPWQSYFPLTPLRRLPRRSMGVIAHPNNREIVNPSIYAYNLLRH